MTGRLPLNSARSSNIIRNTSDNSGIATVNNKKIFTDRQIMNRFVNMVITTELSW